MKVTSTWPTQEFCVGDPMPPISHWPALGFCVGGNTNFMFRFGGNANFSIFRYQHVGIPNSKLWRWGSKPTPGHEWFCVAVEYRLHGSGPSFTLKKVKFGPEKSVTGSD